MQNNIPGADPQRTSWTSVVLLYAIPALLLAWHLAAYVAYAVYAVGYPYGIDFGEGVIWQQALLMPGPRMYGDIHTYPYLVFHYTPLYHAIVRIAGALGADILLAGRLLSVLSTLTACTLVALAARRILADQDFPPGPAWLIAILVGLLPLTFRPIWFWSVLLRSDMLALALTTGGFLLMLHAARREAAGHAAMVLFVLGVYSKQTFIAAPAAALLVWLVRDPRIAVRLGLTGLAVGGVMLVWLTWMTSGGFVRHVFLYNVNPYTLRMLLYNFWSQNILGIYGALAAGAFVLLLWWGRTRLGLAGWASLRERLRDDPRAYRLALVQLYTLSAAAMLVTMGKEGAAFNYLMEWFAIACVALAVLFAWSAALFTASSRRWASMVAPALLAVQLAIAPSPKLGDPEVDRARSAQLDELTEMIRAAARPVLSDNMVALMRAGKEVPLESAIFHSLSSTGAWDQRPFVAMLARGDFAFIVTDGDDDSNLYQSRYTDEMRAAISQAYPVKRRMAGHTVRMPAK